MTRFGWVLLAAACIVGGCDDDDDGGAATAREPAPTEPAAPEAAAREEAAPAEAESSVGPSPAERAARQRQIEEAHRLLRDARHQLRAGRTGQGIATLRQAVRAHPLAAAQCELGWALFQADHVDEARPLLEDAVQKLSAQARLGARERNTLGACLYNLGRVEEQAQDVAAAADAYRRSLSVRDNRVVRSRLDALAGDAPPAPPPDCAPVACDGPVPTLDAAMARAREIAEEVDPLSRRERWSVETEVRVAPRAISEQPSVQAATFATRSGDWAHMELNFVAVRTDEGWFACRVGGGSSDGDTFDGLREIRTAQIIPGGAPEMHVQMSYAYHGHEEGIGNTMGTEETSFVGIEEGRPVVYGTVQTGDFYEDGMWTDCDGECEAAGNLPAECCDDIEALSSRTAYEVVDGPAGRVRFRLTADSDAEDDTTRSFEVSLREMRCAETPTGRSRL